MLKLKDVDKLLTKHFGATWRSMEELRFYATTLSNETHEPAQPNQEEENVEETATEKATCEFIEEIPSVLI